MNRSEEWLEARKDLTHYLQQYQEWLGFGSQSSIEAQLMSYIQLLSKWNRSYSLTQITEPKDMVKYHLAESLALAPIITPKLKNGKLGTLWADLGSGMGVPGIPLAIIFPQVKLHLIDSVQKKTIFLSQIKIELALSNVTVMTQRLESLHPKQSYDAFFARAFAPLPKMLELLGNIASHEAAVFAMKGKHWKEEWQTVTESGMDAEWYLEEVIQTEIEGVDAERQLLVIKKRD